MSIPTGTQAQLRPASTSARAAEPSEPSPEQPIRSAAEVLADWRKLNIEGDHTPLASYPGPAEYRAYYQAAAEHATRRARLLEEAGQLDEVPSPIVQFLIGWVSADLLEHASRMRKDADRQPVDDVEAGEVSR